MTKPTVFYIGKAVPVFGGQHAYLTPINHRNHAPGQDVTNWRPVTTSRVVHWNHQTGRIETVHTVYVPCADPGEEKADETATPLERPVKEGVKA